VFQNPRLSVEGLVFYYRDYYEGLGERRSDEMFRMFFKRSYATCAELLRECLPASEGEALDVGCGHANFAWIARQAMPGLEVDGLDLAECVDLAAQRGWLRRGFRGQFTELAAEMAAARPYDAVTMRHYLEHTRDPRAEIAAARQVLKPGGLLIIEVPNPDSRWRHLFRRYWPEWFQPQHQHLVPSRNMDRLLREQEFTPLRWQFAETQLPSDFSVGAFLFLGSWVAYCDRPWLPPSSRARRAWRGLFWGITAPVFVVTVVLDALTLLAARSVRSTNVYRVVARRA
jgi:SAM-dependent methyltransferase